MKTGNILIEKEIKSKTSNNVYALFIFENAISCSCPAGGKGQMCKHMVSAIHENLELIKATVPDFYNRLMKVIEIKFSKNIPSESKLKEYAKVVYINKEISKVAHENLVTRTSEHELKATKFISIVWQCRNCELYHFVNTSIKNPDCLFYSPKYKELEELAEANFIKIFPMTFESYKKYVHYSKEDLRKKLKENNIKCLCKYSEEQTIQIAKDNNFFENDVNNYCLISATEQMTDNKRIIGYLHKERSKYVTDKKILKIGFFKEN